MEIARYIVKWSPGTYAALDVLDRDERAELEETFRSFAWDGIDPDADDRIRVLSPSESLYTVKVTPRLLVNFRTASIGPYETLEILDIVRPETLREFARKMAAPPASP